MKRCVITSLLTLFVLLGNAQSERRLALVIGNAAYQHGGVLRNPVNDANLIANTLNDLGFTVIKKTNADLRAMQSGFVDFVSQMNDYDVLLFFYAGHGMQVNGENYLLPIDAQADNAMSLEFEGFEVSKVNKYFASNQGKTNIMILDACRDNPYRSWSRGGNRGFKAVSNQGAGTIISFATSEGETASDGSGTNGLFTKHLAQQMRVSQNITDVFQNTRIHVLKESSNQQIPQEWNMLTGHFNFAGATNASVATPSTGPSLGNSVSLAKYGSIEFRTAVGGELYLDGQFLGSISAQSKTPINDIAIGNHTLEIRGQKNWRGQVDVVENQMIVVNAQDTYLSKIEKMDQLFMDMVRVEGGTFVMGGPDGGSAAKPAHKVELSDFEIGKYEVTWGQWEEIMGSGDVRLEEYHNGCDRCPVEYVSWSAAQEFIERLYAKTGIPFRLPTEAEWEYAARSGINNDSFNYAGSDDIDQVAWYKENSNDAVHFVGQKIPNALGIYDMTGNVAEWCSDYFNRSYYSRSDERNPKGPGFGLTRVIRGGSIKKSHDYIHVTYRAGRTPSDWSGGVGFRVARDVD